MNNLYISNNYYNLIDFNNDNKLSSQFNRVENGKEKAKSRAAVANSMKKPLGVNDPGNRFAAKYNEFRSKQCASQAPYYINLNKVLYDEEVKYEVEDSVGDVSDDYWKIMGESEKQFDIEINHLKSELRPLWAKHCIAKYLGIIYNREEIESREKEVNKRINELSNAKKAWGEFSSWAKKLLTSQEGKNNPGYIKTRVANLYQQILQASEKDKNRLLDLVMEYNLACPDRAIVGLEKAEVVAEIINAGEDLKLNVLILEFKRHLIQTELVIDSQSESVETYLFYSIYLNDVLGLKNKNKSMAFASMAVKRSFENSINAVFKRMTVEDLIGFISNHEMFQEAYQEEYRKIIDGLQGEIADLDFDDPLYEQKAIELDNKYKRTVSCFYQDKAQELLLEKGFITEDVNYEDPEALPGAQILEPKQLACRLMENSNTPILIFCANVLFEQLRPFALLIVSEEWINNRALGLSLVVTCLVLFPYVIVASIVALEIAAARGPIIVLIIYLLSVFPLFIPVRYIFALLNLFRLN